MTELTEKSKAFINAFAEANCGTWNSKPVNMSAAEAYQMIVENQANGLPTQIENGHFKVLNLSKIQTPKWLYQLPGMEHLRQVDILDVRAAIIWELFVHPETTIKKIIIDALPKAYSGTRFINIIHNDYIEAIEGIKSYGPRRKLNLYCTEAQKKKLKFGRKKTVFCYPKDPIERHDFADQEPCNWDRGLDMLTGIIKDPTTDKATALKIYWDGKPEWYLQYKDFYDIPYGEERDRFRFLKTIRYKIEDGFYTTGNASFDPAKSTNLYPDLPKHELEFNKIPTSFYQKVG